MKDEIRELNQVIANKCEKAVATEWDGLDRGYPGGEYPAIRLAPGIASNAALKALETGDIIGVRADAKWLRVEAIEPLTIPEPAPSDDALN